MFLGPTLQPGSSPEALPHHSGFSLHAPHKTEALLLGGSHYLLMDRVSQILQDHGHDVSFLQQSDLHFPSGIILFCGLGLSNSIIT